MLEQKNYDNEELNNIIFYAQSSENLQGAIEAQDHLKFYGKNWRKRK